MIRSTCSRANTCKASTTSFGLGLGYHLVNGSSFDPWMQAGMGYRFAKFEQSPSATFDYSGFDWLRLAIGGEWYAAKWLGIGPYASFDAGTYSARPAGTNSAVHMFLSLGMRAVIDPPCTCSNRLTSVRPMPRPACARSIERSMTSNLEKGRCNGCSAHTRWRPDSDY